MKPGVPVSKTSGQGQRSSPFEQGNQQNTQTSSGNLSPEVHDEQVDRAEAEKVPHNQPGGRPPRPDGSFRALAPRFGTLGPRDCAPYTITRHNVSWRCCALTARASSLSPAAFAVLLSWSTPVIAHGPEKQLKDISGTVAPKAGNHEPGAHRTKPKEKQTNAPKNPVPCIISRTNRPRWLSISMVQSGFDMNPHLFEFDVERPPPKFTLKPEPRKPSSWLLPRCIMRWPTLTTRSCHSAEAKAREVEGPGCPFPQSSSCNSGYNYGKHGFVQAPFDAMRSVRSLQLTDGWPDLWQKTVFALYGNDVNPRLRIERSISGAGGCLVFVCFS